MACVKNPEESVNVNANDCSLIVEKPLKMVAGSFYIPKNNGFPNPQGEDSHFICLEKQTIGVADGVGGWHEKGIDAGEFARNLMTNTVKALEKQPKGHIALKKVLNEAFIATNDQGSSTACILTLQDDSARAINVGDSGFMLIRNGTEELYKSPVQQAYFNCPYQLGKSINCQNPSVAQMFIQKINSGDVIIAGTDGLFDNMFLEQIRDLAKEGIKEGKDPTQVAWSIAEHAYYISTDRKAHTPVSKAASMSGRPCIGGKADDITVIVAYITDDI
ncbi:SpoIIE domain-containing protein [Cephalotus follicularis]|uniref:Protein phosphatase n=1 Tax=Cephalotus follicularis TaxID=3775 RepID=A0A1Q3D953_CEPFO|nr:SpoIIE domain-containing protein [Cephalotus follicularis]